MSQITDADIANIPGWFFPVDVALFRLLLDETTAQLGTGDLAEMGAYLGKSAVLIGAHAQEGETFTVVDLFGSPASDSANATEAGDQYGSLTRRQFEENYLRVHGELPVVIEDLSSVITERAALGKHRFVHVDASHLYEHVTTDIASARELLSDDGVVVLDDFRSEHTPGVAAAAWGAVAAGLKPFAVTSAKMYATWGDQPLWLKTVAEWAPTSGFLHETQTVGDHEVVRLWTETHEAARFVPPVLLPAAAKLRRKLRSLR